MFGNDKLLDSYATSFTVCRLMSGGKQTVRSHGQLSTRLASSKYTPRKFAHLRQANKGFLFED